MKIVIWILAALCASAAAWAVEDSTGSFLDIYLNNIKLDQKSPDRGKDNASRYLRSGVRFGQTFVTGPEVTEIYQIAVQSPHYNAEWAEGVSLVLALYDSPDRATKLAEFEMIYEWRSWEDMIIVFPVGVRVEPGRTYYFELTSRGGSGQIGPIMLASGDYPRGQAYVNGEPQDFDFAFQTYVRTTWDRDKAYEQAFAMLDLDHPGLEAVKAAVERKDWERAARAMVNYFESRPQFRTVADRPKGRTIPDLSTADLAAEMKLRDAEGAIISLGPNWNHLRWWPTRGGVGLTRQGIRKDLAAGYFNTRDRKYAVAFNELIKAVLVDLPSPIKSGVVPPGSRDIPPIFPGGIAGGSMWAGLAIGARIAHEFYYYAVFADSPDFTWDVRAAFIFNLADMADVLAIQQGGGNWATQMYDHLFYFGTEFPEFARSREYAALAFEGLVSNMRETLLPDGPIGESAGYQMMVHRRYVELIGRARSLGLEIPQDLVRNVEDAIAFHMYTIRPDGQRPPFGDALADDPRPMIKSAAEEFGRKDMLWVATEGAEGVQPKKTSVEFPYSKYYVMRSDWGPDARYMVLKNGRYTSHGHFDSLGFEMFAFGNPIFVDPGVYIYGTPETIKLMSTASHSTISVDGANLHNGGSPNQFFAGECVDYLNAVGPGYQGLEESVYPVRRVVFLKPDYWVFSDVIYGHGERRVDSRFHFADTNASLDPDTQIAVTDYQQGGNLAMIPVDTRGAASSLDDGHTAYVHEKMEPALILRRSTQTELPVRMDNVAYPYRDGSMEAVVTALTPVAGRAVETSGIRIDTDKGTDYVVFTRGQSGAAAFLEADLRLKGQFGCVRKDAAGVVTGFAWIWGTSLDSGALLAASDHPIPGLDVVYDGDVVRVTTRGSHPSLRLAANGRSLISVNGGPAVRAAVQNGMFRPFAHTDADHEEFVIVDDETAGFRIEKPIKGSSVGGDDQIGFSYYWAHVAPGRESLISYSPTLPAAGAYEVSVYVPKFRQIEITREAKYVVRFLPGGKWTGSVDDRVVAVDDGGAVQGELTVIVDQASAAGSWVSLGVFEFAGGHARLELSADAPTGGPVMLADAARWTRR